MKIAAALDPVAESMWRAAFSALGRWSHPRASQGGPEGGQRILVIAPHPDDEVVGCAGTLLLHVRSGDSVCIAYVTDGSRSRAGGLGPEEMRRQRRLEAEAAAGSLQVDRFEWFGLIEGEWIFEEFWPLLLRLLRQTSPQLIYAPSRVDFHPEHRKVAHGLSLLFLKEGVQPPEAAVRVYQLQVPLTALLTNRVIDCSGVAERVEDVFRVYGSQSANLGRALRTRRYAARFYGFREHAEEFWQMPLAEYCRLHNQAPDAWRCGRFRGIRYRSFSDPLSYVLGRTERRRLRTVPAAEAAPQA